MSKVKTVAIVQSSYIPWRGYFDLIRAADCFVLLDDVQFTKRDWRSRNCIKTANGVAWLSVPALTKGRRFQRILETEVANREWPVTHWESIRHAYSKAPFFEAYKAPLSEVYREAATLPRLSDVNALLLRRLSELLGIGTPLVFSHEILSLQELDAADSSTRLARLTEAVGGSVYLSGPSARDYLVGDPFFARNIDVRFVDYGGYPQYLQRHGQFEPAVSAVDLLFNVGARAQEYMVDLASRSTPLVAPGA
jgi:hypothetical protein